MKKTLLHLALVLVTASIFAQNPTLDWAVQMGGSGVDIGYSITTDTAGNVYTTGLFEGTADFDPGAGTMNLTATGGHDIFVQKLDVNGDFLWARQMGGSDRSWGESITTDTEGNVYTTGSFEGTVDFDPGAGTMNLTSLGLIDQWDIFVQKLDANGDFLWVRQMGGSGQNQGLSISTDSAGNVYTAGAFMDTVDFDPGVGTMNLISTGSTRHWDMFIQKLDANGDFLWAIQMGASDHDVGSSITTDAVGNVYTTGAFKGTVDFDPGAGTMNLTSAGDRDIFVQKFDVNGDFLWARQMGGSGQNQGLSISTDSAGNVYTAGYFGSTVDFDPGAGTMNLTSVGDRDIFVQKLDANGDFLWARQMGGRSEDIGFSITTDAAGNVYTTGFFNGTGDFDPGAGTMNLTSAGHLDIFVQKLDSNGGFLWAIQMGASDNDLGYSITTDTEGNVYTTGFFYGTADFDPGAGTMNLTSAGSVDIFVQKLKQQCAIDTSTTLNGINITANTSGATYQWLDCNNNFAVISGASSQTFTAGLNGNYAVEITQGGCIDTSACVNISTVGIDNSIFNQVSIYPNPTQSLVNIELGQLKDVSIIITDATGKVLHQKSQINAGTYSVELKESAGLYFVEIISNDKRQWYKLMKL